MGQQKIAQSTSPKKDSFKTHKLLQLILLNLNKQTNKVSLKNDHLLMLWPFTFCFWLIVHEKRYFFSLLLVIINSSSVTWISSSTINLTFSSPAPINALATCASMILYLFSKHYRVVVDLHPIIIVLCFVHLVNSFVWTTTNVLDQLIFFMFFILFFLVISNRFQW